MSEDLRIVLGSVVEVFGLVGLSAWYCTKTKADLSGAMRLVMQFFLPCLVFTSILEARLEPREAITLSLATALQIGIGLALGYLILRTFGRAHRPDLLLPIAFVNSANLPFPLVIANFGHEGLARAVVCYLTTTVSIYTLGQFLVQRKSSFVSFLREPTVWGTAVALAIRALPVEVPEMALRIPRLASTAAVPLMLVVFGETLARTRVTAFGDAALAAVARYLTGLVSLAVALLVLRPEGMVRSVIVLYALLPSAVVNVMLVRRAGREADGVAGAVLFASLVAVAILPVVLARLH